MILPCGFLARAGIVEVVPAVAVEGGASKEIDFVGGIVADAAPEPRVVRLLPFRLLAAVFAPFHIRFYAKDASVSGNGAGGVSFMKGRMLIRTPSFTSGSQPIGCSRSGFHRAKRS